MSFFGIKKLFTIEGLIALSIFISSYTFFTQPFEGYFHYIIFILLLPYFISRYGFLQLPIKIMIIPALFGIYNLAVDNVTAFGFIKIFFGMILSINFYSYVFLYFNKNLEKLFNLYLNGIVLCCYIAIIQLVSYTIHFKTGYDYTWIFNKWKAQPGSLFGLRLNSIFPEPSQFALLLLPAVFLAIHHLISRNFIVLNLPKCILIIGCLILTTSSTGYIGILFSLIIFAIQFRKLVYILVVGIVAFFGFSILYAKVDEFRSRVDSSVNLWTKDRYSIDDINSSSFVLFNNFHIAKENLMEHPLTGTGLGSYPEVYEKYSLTKADDFLIKTGFDFNSQDGNSLFIRSMAELGITGVLFWVLFILRCFRFRDSASPENITWIFSSACLLLVLGYLLRQGNYFINGFPFFVLFYYYASKEENNVQDETEEAYYEISEDEKTT